MADPDWSERRLLRQAAARRAGLAVARMVGHITYMSDESMREKFGRRLREKEKFGFDFAVDFEVESYLRYRGNQFVGRFDANSYLYITKAEDYFDLTNGAGTLAEAFQQGRGAISGDQLQLRLAVSQLPVAGNRARAAAAATAMWPIASCTPITVTTRFWWTWRNRPKSCADFSKAPARRRHEARRCGTRTSLRP